MKSIVSNLKNKYFLTLFIFFVYTLFLDDFDVFVIISQKNKSVGDFVPTGTTVFQITQNKNMEIYAQVPGIYFNKLK